MTLRQLADRMHRESTRTRQGMSGFEWGVVTDNADPDGLCRVKVRMPWMGDAEDSYWIPQLGAGGAGYGSTAHVPQEGEAVAVLFWQGSIHTMAYLPASFTVGGQGATRPVKPALPADKTDAALYHQTVHQPEDGKFKVWWTRTIGGMLTWVGEGLHWARYLTPGASRAGYGLDIEHDVPVGGKTKGDKVPQTPYDAVKITTPSGHRIEIIEHEAAQVNRITITHTSGHTVELFEGGGQHFLHVTDGKGQSVRLDGTTTTVSVAAGSEVSVNAGSVINEVAPVINVNGGIVNLAGGGPPVARVGDQVDPVTHKIVSGSGAVFSG